MKSSHGAKWEERVKTELSACEHTSVGGARPITPVHQGWVLPNHKIISSTKYQAPPL